MALKDRYNLLLGRISRNPHFTSTPLSPGLTLTSCCSLLGMPASATSVFLFGYLNSRGTVLEDATGTVELEIPEGIHPQGGYVGDGMCVLVEGMPRGESR